MKYLLILVSLFTIYHIRSQSDSTQILALKYYNNQEYMEAMQLWESCIEKDSANGYCYEQAGLTANRLGLLAKAKENFTKIENEPTYFQTACINLANIYESQELLPKAIKYNRRLRDSFPENPIYHRKLGSLMMKAGIAAEAFNHYAQANKLNPNDITTIKALSEIFISNSQFEDADSLLHYALSLDSTNASISLLLARNYYSMKNYDSTVVILDGLRGKIDFSNYHNRMFGYALLQIDSVEQSIWYLQRSLVDESNPEFAHYYLANAYELLEDPETAEFHYQKAIEAGTSNGLHTYHRNLARIQKNENQLKEAIDNYQWAYKYREDPLILLYLGQAADEYYKDKNIAINYYNQYIRSEDTNESYKKYAKERVQLLKEYVHQNRN